MTIKSDIDLLQGHWAEFYYERDGIINPVDVESGWHPQTHISGLNFTVKIADGSTILVGDFVLDETRQPKEITWRDTSGSYACDHLIKAIYSLTETEFVFCASYDDGALPPAEFKTKSGQVLRRMRRVS